MARALIVILCATSVNAQIVGYYEKTFAPSAALEGATIGVAFSGWANASLALSQSKAVSSTLVGDKYIALGGGNKNGRFSSEILTDTTAALEQGNFSDYVGVVFDIEECAAAGLASYFGQAFRAAKLQDLKVVVTVSNAAPYGCTDAQVLMRSFIANTDVDMLSPQLYNTGAESQPYFNPGDKGIVWQDYLHMQGKFVPSIVRTDQYPSVQGYFRDAWHITTDGYFQWAAAPGPAPSPPPSPPPTPGPNIHGNHTVKRGDSCWNIAQEICHDGASYAKTICDANKVCALLQPGQVIKYDCSGTGKFCDSAFAEFMI